MYKILIVDDEPAIRMLIAKYAHYEGHAVIQGSDGMEAVALCRSESPDIAVIDIMMPELDGFSACREIRKFSDVPIIMLSARGEEYDRINGFELGIDDYVVKPFSPKELMLRVDAILNRYAKGCERLKSVGPIKPEIYEFGGVRADATARIVTVDGERVDMTPKEYELLFYMLRNRNIALAREQLINHVWGYDYFGDDRTLDTHIKLLRRSLGKYSSFIVTLRGVGYRFDSDAQYE